MNSIEKSESIVNLVAAICKVSATIKGVEKNSNVGSGGSAYKGVKDYDVKKAVSKLMSENGLVIFPIDYNPNVKIERWEEMDNYAKAMKTKQSVFTEIIGKYRIAHISGEYQDIIGYGHGIDTQDKSAGKATTYALKYLMLYLFNIPVGEIDDTDTEHSDDMAVPKTEKKTADKKTPTKEEKPTKVVTPAPDLKNFPTSISSPEAIAILEAKDWNGQIYVSKDKSFEYIKVQENNLDVFYKLPDNIESLLIIKSHERHKAWKAVNEKKE